MTATEIARRAPAGSGNMVFVGFEFEWSTDVAQADWWANALHGFARDVGSIVPATFPAYARVFHPTFDGRRWADIAAANGRVAHAEMQFHEIIRPVGEAAAAELDYEYHGSFVGSMEREELIALAEILASHAATPTMWCCVWEGFGQLHGGAAVGRLSSDGTSERFEGIVPIELRSAAKVVIPHRAYYLLHGPISALDEFFDFFWRQSPNVWWPDDRAWIVATEIDFSWTYVAGSEAAVADVLADDRLEALRADPSHGFRYDGDTLNRALDEDAP